VEEKLVISSKASLNSFLSIYQSCCKNKQLKRRFEVLKGSEVVIVCLLVVTPYVPKGRYQYFRAA
jgi:hypothetical protein